MAVLDTSLVQPSVSTLDLQVATHVPKIKDSVSSDSSDTLALLVDQAPESSADQVGSYTSAPGTLTLETASDSILSVSTDGSSDSKSGSIDEENFALQQTVNLKLLGLMTSFVMASMVLGTM